jgi:hypothetical protein
LGIPNNLRRKVWKFLSKSGNLAFNYEKNFFRCLLDVQNDELECSIKKDIERTLLSEEEVINKNSNKEKDEIDTKMVKDKKRRLFKILKAYAVYDTQVGYCQGTNFIVMLILTVIPSATEAFFVQIMHGKNWRGLFTPNTPKLMKLLEELVTSVRLRIPDLYQHFEEQNVNMALKYFSSSINFQVCLLTISLLFSHMEFLSSILLEYSIYFGYMLKLF